MYICRADTLFLCVQSRVRMVVELSVYLVRVPLHLPDSVCQLKQGTHHLLSTLWAELSLKYVKTGAVHTGPGPLLHLDTSHVNPMQVGSAVHAFSASIVV